MILLRDSTTVRLPNHLPLSGSMNCLPRGRRSAMEQNPTERHCSSLGGPIRPGSPRGARAPPTEFPMTVHFARARRRDGSWRPGHNAHDKAPPLHGRSLTKRSSFHNLLVEKLFLFFFFAVHLHSSVSRETVFLSGFADGTNLGLYHFNAVSFLHLEAAIF